MVHHELSQWPLVISVSSGLQTLESMQAFTEDWNRWLDRGPKPQRGLRTWALVAGRYLSIDMRTSFVCSGATSTTRFFFAPFGAESCRVWRPEGTGRLKMCPGPSDAPLSMI